MNSMLGVYASFQTIDFEAIERGDDKGVEAFKEYLWGEDRNGGLGEKLKKIEPVYGNGVNLILFQFNVNPRSDWPQPKSLENYNPKEKSVGVWIDVDNENFFSKNDDERDKYINNQIIDRLEQLKKRFKTRKLDVDMDKLIGDIKQVLGFRD